MSASTSSHSSDALWRPDLSPTGDARAQRGRPDWTDIAFFLLLAVGAGYALTGYGSAMDYYEKIILCGAVFRSEEHTSELQSLMRISYAVFCLKKKKTYT